jgi:hypothetical protein
MSLLEVFHRGALSIWASRDPSSPSALIISMSGQPVSLKKWLEAFGVTFVPAGANSAFRMAVLEAAKCEAAYDLVLKPTASVVGPCETDPDALGLLPAQLLQSDVRQHGVACSSTLLAHWSPYFSAMFRGGFAEAAQLQRSTKQLAISASEGAVGEVKMPASAPVELPVFDFDGNDVVLRFALAHLVRLTTHASGDFAL